MNLPPGTTSADPASLVDHVAQRYFICTGFLLADVWLPQAVMLELGRRIGVPGETLHTAALQQLAARDWLRVSPNGRWLKLLPHSPLHDEWKRQPQALREYTRQLLQDVLLWYAPTLQHSGDHETLALVLRQLVHLAHLAAAVQDPGIVHLLIGIGTGFEWLGMRLEARKAYNDAIAALHQRLATLEAAV